MHVHSMSIRSFVGAKDFRASRTFYRDIGFTESKISPDLSYFEIGGNIGFYLQDYYVKDWVDNSMLFLEVQKLEEYLEQLRELRLPEKYPHVRLSGIKQEDWGMECFLHDPSGVLWHIGQFNREV